MTVFVLMTTKQMHPLMILSQPNVDHLLPVGTSETFYFFKSSYRDKEVVGEWVSENNDNVWRLIAYSVIPNPR
jgi:hypothetical protein